MKGLSFRRRNRDLGEMLNSFSDFFNEDFFAPVRGDIHHFRTDIKDSGKEYVIEAEMPGFDKQDINVDYNNNYLTISAKRDDVTKDEKDNYIRQERHFGEFVRRFYVEDIDENLIDAKFKNGVLTLTCPKLMISGNEPKRIEIH